MALLLDTHVVLWWLVDDAELDSAIKDRLDVDSEIFVSSATVWEVGSANRKTAVRMRVSKAHHSELRILADMGQPAAAIVRIVVPVVSGGVTGAALASADFGGLATRPITAASSARSSP